jgi:transposase-like protein
MNIESTRELLENFPDEASCLQHLEQLRWNGIVVSPFSPNSKVYYCSDNKYKCRDTGKYFNAKTNTMFHNSRISLQKWFIAIWMIALEKHPVTSVGLAKELQITQKSAWFMIQRIIAHFGLKKSQMPKRTKSVVSDIEKVDVIADSDRLKMIEWLKLLKG